MVGFVFVISSTTVTTRPLLYLCRLFSDDSEDSIQFMADSDERQDDDAAIKSSVYTANDHRSEITNEL